MLKSLFIQNYALIDTLDISFSPGFSVITGETGAGKSIILGAIGLLLGQRADSKAIKAGAAKCVIEAQFDLSAYAMYDFFAQNDLEFDGQECIIRREITAAGKSRAFVNDTPAPVALLKALGAMLIDIHSQHQNLLLGQEDFQLNVVDILAADAEELQRYKAIYADFKQAEKALAEAQEKAAAAKAEEDYIAFQLEQLEQAGLKSGEQEELEQESATLAHAEDIKQGLFQTAHLLGDEQGIVDALKEACHLMGNLAKVYPAGGELAERLETCHIELKDIAGEIDSRAEHVEFDPERLQFVNERLNTLYELQQKHRADTVDRLLDIQADYRERLDSITHSDEFIRALQARKLETAQAVEAQAARLTALRRKAAAKAEKEMTAKLAPLGIPNAQFRVEIAPKEKPDATGADKTQFLFCANKNGHLQPISQVASGGEIARVMLSLKALVSGAVKLPTIIFDEIDTGVSGHIAEKMACIMRDMGRSDRQVISITHLPQIAAMGTAHYKVYKEDGTEGTTSHIVQLTPQGRVEEIAHMLSGSVLTEEAINNAKALLNASQNPTT